MKSTILIKFLDEEIWLYKKNELIKEATEKIISNNFITNNKSLEKSLKIIFNKHKILNSIIQNNIYILINKLYCETNKYIIKNVMYNLGISNYKLIYEEDLYNEYNTNILSYWNNNGIYINNNREFYIDYKTNLSNILEDGALVITANREILSYINKKIIVYEDTICPVFNIILNCKDKKIN